MSTEAGNKVVVVISSVQLRFVLALLYLCVTTPAHPLPGRRVHHRDYSRRFAQVTRQCQSLLSSATVELTVDPERVEDHFNQLLFTDGDWSQDAGHAPLFQFRHEFPEAAVRLVSFRLMHVQLDLRQRAFNISGLLLFNLTCNGDCRPKEPQNELANLDIYFEGIYIETPSSLGSGSGDGERVLCMVGNSALPMRSSNGTSSGDGKKGHGGETTEPPPTEANSDILLVLRYSKVHTLTTRAVRGEMTSLASKLDGAYFDAVRLVSRLGQHSLYKPRREDEAGGCSDDDGDVPGHAYRGASFCDILAQFTADRFGNALLPVVPNWHCNSTDAPFCGRPGPFELGAAAADERVRSTASTRSAVTVQDLRCSQGRDTDGTPRATVAAVFRFVAPWEDHPTAVKRTGLGGATLSAEGAWNAATGRLCMVACRGPGDAACHYRVTLFVPTALSITRRSIIVGQITAMDGSHYPLSFQQGLRQSHDWHHFGWSGEPVPMAYHYTKVEQAMAMQELNHNHNHWRASRFRDNFIAKSILSYPKVAGAGAADDLVSLSKLAENMSFSFQPKPNKTPFVPEWIENPVIAFEILSIGSLFGSYSPWFEDGSSSTPVVQEQLDSGHGVQQMLNVSAVFTASKNGDFIRHTETLIMLLEGVYNPEDARMFLIGCRNVDAPWLVLSTIRDLLEDGMDCSIEITVEYPPAKNWWMASPFAKISIASSRDSDDPLHFSRTEHWTLPNYHYHDDMLRESMEGLLSIAVQLTAIAAVVSQLSHISSHREVTPYVSLAMLGVQALGHSTTLVAGAARTVPAAWPYESSVKAALTLAELLLTLWLAQKVWASRDRARARSPLEPGRVPRDSAVLLRTLAVHLCCLSFVLAVHWLGTACCTPTPAATPAPNSSTWGRVAGRYVGVAVKEWFLLPQVIANAAWRVNCKPLAARYYAGITVAWLLQHVLGYLWVGHPFFDMYAEAHYEINMLAVVVPVVGVLLPLLVYVQQRWNYKIVGWTEKTKRKKPLQHDH